MSRRIPLAVLTVSVALGVAIPAVAQTRTTRHANRHLSLRMGGHIVKVVKGRTPGVIAAGSGSTVSYQGFSCQVTVGQGATDTTYVNHRTNDSTEFYVPHVVNGTTYYSVTTNCIGTLAAGTPVAHTIVTATTANCGQINPFDKTKFITGSGITTTFPDGMFSETCNTPDFQ
jgi:hypothetical protein